MLLLQRLLLSSFLFIIICLSNGADAIFISKSTTKHLSSNHDRNKSSLVNAESPHLGTRGGAIQAVADEENYKISLSPLAFSSIFAFLGGWSHALCNKKFDAYTAMVSGHIINMSVSLAENQWREAFRRMSIVGSYFGGVVSGRFIELKCENSTVDKVDKGKVVKDVSPTNKHFKIIAAIVVVTFAMAEKLEKIQVNLLTFGYGLIYPSVSATLGGTILHLLTGHTTNVARLVGANQIHHKGMKTSICMLGSVICGAIFGRNAMVIFGEEFPYFSMLGLLYAAFLLLL